MPKVQAINDGHPCPAKLTTKAWDIDGMYPNMLRSHIDPAMEHIINQAFDNAPNREKRITIPRSKHLKPFWGVNYDICKKLKSITLSKDNIFDLIKFTLNNAISKFQNIIVKQQKGIPQGDSLSPAIAIGTCAHQEIK